MTHLVAGRSNRQTIVTVLLLSLAGLFLYTLRLGRTLYLHYDEVYFAIQAHSIAVTGHDTNGRFMPVYFEASSGSWFQPAVVYFTALFLTLLPLSDAVLRLPTVFISLFNVILIYFIARKIFEREAWAVVTAVSLMLTPAHIIHGRLALSYVYPVFFLLAWLLCLMIFLEREKPWLLFVATTFLGLGFFTYIAAVAMMPLYLCMTCVVLWARSQSTKSDVRRLRTSSFVLPSIATAVAGFAWPVLATLPFHLKYPHFMLQKWGTYGPSGVGHRLDPLQQVSELLSYNNLSYRVSLFFSFFNPGYLFLSGGSNVVNSTREAGVFLLPLAIFIPVGIYQLLQHRRNPVNLVILAGFITAPVAASFVAESGAVDRELEVLPFGVLLATFGIEYLWQAPLTIRLRPLFTPGAAAGFATGVVYAVWTIVRRGYISRATPLLIIASFLIYAIGSITDATRRWRPITACLLLLGLLQFQYFYRDYLTDYPIRTAGWFMNNRRGALDAVFKQADQHTPVKVFVSRNIQYADTYWRLYTSMFGRDDLQSAMVYFDPAMTRVEDVPDGALVLLPDGESAKEDRAFAAQAQFVPVSSVHDSDGTASFMLLKKHGQAR